MKRVIILILCIVIADISVAQRNEQTIIVKRPKSSITKSKGEKIPGAFVSLKEDNVYESDSNGMINFVVKNNKYHIDSVYKREYALVDTDILREYDYTSIPEEILMEKDSILLVQVISQENSYTKQLGEHALKDRKDIYKQTIDDPNNRINALEANFSHSVQAPMLAESLAEQMTGIYENNIDVTDGKIMTLIEKGELIKAERQLARRGDIDTAIVNFTSRKANSLNKNEEYKQKRSLAMWCLELSRINTFRFNFTEGANYLEKRISIDTTNIRWQIEAGKYIADHLNEYDRALNIYQQALGRCKSKTNSKQCADLHYEIGDLYIDKKQYSKALDNYSEALNIYKDIFDEDHKLIALTLYKIGIVHHRQKHHNMALEHLFEALNKQQKTLQKNDPDIAETYHTIGHEYYHRGDMVSALYFYFKAAEIKESIIGRNKLSTAYVYKDIGLALYNKGDLQSAITYYKLAEPTLEETLGKDHESTRGIYYDIGNAYSKREEYDQALVYFERILNYYDRFKINECASYALINEYIGNIYDKKKKYSVAKGYFEEAKRIFHILGKEVEKTRNHDNIKWMENKIQELENKKSKKSSN